MHPMLGHQNVYRNFLITLRLHYNADFAWLPNIFPVYYVWKYQQMIAVYTMQAMKIVPPVYFLAKFDTS